MRTKQTRTAAIIIAIILGLAALFYLGGLVCQLLEQYQLWLASGGLSGKVISNSARYRAGARQLQSQD